MRRQVGAAIPAVQSAVMTIFPAQVVRLRTWTPEDRCPPTAEREASGSSSYPRSDAVEFNADSSGGQTLPSLKAETLKDKSKLPRNQRGRFTTSSRDAGTRRKVTRSCKIMNDAYFKRIECFQTFVSGPCGPKVEPLQL